MNWPEIITQGLDIFLRFLKKRNAGDAFIDAGKIGTIIRHVVRHKTNLNIDCFFLIMAHNSGGKVMPHDFKYRSIVDGDYNDARMKMNMSDYKSLPIDYNYSQILAEVYLKKQTAVLTKDLDEGETLETMFEALRLKKVVYFFLHQRKDRFWYLAVGTTVDGETLESAEQQQTLYLAVNKIQQIIKPY